MKSIQTIIFRMLMLVMAPVVLASCSVVMAAKKDGTTIETVQASRSRGQIIASGANVISSERLSNGDLVEVYQFQQERGSAARALMHGALDVGTLGLWEVVGTPIEACLDEKKFFSLKAYYDQWDNVQKIELL